jgi:hypothetical protein
MTGEAHWLDLAVVFLGGFVLLLTLYLATHTKTTRH